MLVLKDINKEYPQDKGTLHVLKDINLTFPSSGFITILGPSGCGKTTLLNLIGGLDIYTSGDLIIEEKAQKNILQVIGIVIAITISVLFFNHIT